jgi:hypothetical protein
VKAKRVKTRTLKNFFERAKAPDDFFSAAKLLMPTTFAASELSREEGAAPKKRQRRRAGWKPVLRKAKRPA